MNADRLAASAAALVAGEHPDPFAFLGPHVEDGMLVVRAFVPGARAITVVRAADGSVAAPLRRRHPAGVFAGRVAGASAPFAYRLRIEPGGGEIDDPYRFPPLLGELDLHLLAEGRHYQSYRKLGAHPRTVDGVRGTHFAVWAPNARRVSVVGDFNDWDGRRHPMRLHPGGGVWEIFLPGVAIGALYKYEVLSRAGARLLKADPYAMASEPPPRTASVVHGLPARPWDDAAGEERAWMAARGARNDRRAPIAIYEAHLGSWRRRGDEGNRYLTYRELADELVPYVADMGFTHIEVLPVSEHPFDGSWGYQPTALYAPTSRFGTPEDFQAFVARCHAHGLGVILDWVAGHFPTDPHGLACFDGSHLYEHADPRQGLHREWDTLIYNYGRREVANFLLSNALYWLECFHIDGLRVDAVAAMLYLDYARREGEWIPNRYGGRENLEAIAFLRRMNELVYARGDGAVTVAEESTAWPMVSRPTYLGGLGFGYKWNMGWMNDTLAYMAKDPVHRKFAHDKLTFGLLYAFTENFILPLSHDEVVHGKGSLLAKMPGDRWQKFANLRAYLAFMYTQPGKKLLFMGDEFGHEREWSHDRSLDWALLDGPLHAGLAHLVRDLNALYRGEPALHELDCEAAGFAWIDCQDRDASVISYLRKAADGRTVVAVCNFTPVVRHGYRIGVPVGGEYDELLNTDSTSYGGSDVGNAGRVTAQAVAAHGFTHSLELVLPPLATLVFRPAPA